MIQGIPPVDCGGKREKDNGNGSLMRILPLAFVSKSYTDNRYTYRVENVSSFTHAHDRSKFACIFYVKLAAELFVGKEKMEAFDSAIGFVDKNCGKKYADERKNFETILNKDIIYTEKSRIRSTGYVIDTLEAVLWLFFHTESYRDVVLNAVNLGETLIRSLLSPEGSQGYITVSGQFRIIGYRTFAGNMKYQI